MNMICTKSKYDISDEHEPFALGNQYLTPALVEHVDNGAKNLLPNGEASQSDTVWIDYPVSLPAGTYQVYLGTYSSTDTDDTRAQLYFLNGSTLLNVQCLITKAATGMNATITTTGTCDKLRVYASDNTSHSSSDTVTISKVMICTLADWKVSQKFVPYRPSWDIIQAAIRRQTFTIEPGTDITIGQQSAYKMNGYVWISLQLKSSTNLSANAAREVCYLPSTTAKQGTALVVLVGSVEESDTNPKAYISSYSNKQAIKIKPTGTIPANTWFYITGTFMTNLPY